ncbi:MAG: hypothetical protein ACUZ8H_01015 [Candidatus Anammoxibacter sp.]
MNLVIILLSTIPIVLTAICYFYTKVKSAVFFLAIFYVVNIYASHAILYESHIYIFYAIISFTCIIPALLLVSFALDVKYALFCLDTSFFVLLTWVMVPFILPLNIVFLLLTQYGAVLKLR